MRMVWLPEGLAADAKKQHIATPLSLWWVPKVQQIQSCEK